jgi:hypothetical protein
MVDTTSCSDSSALEGRHGRVWGGEPHASHGAYHDRESFVAAIAATFGEPDTTPAPASQCDVPQPDVVSQIRDLLKPRQAAPAAAALADGAGAATLDLIEGHKSEKRLLLKTENYLNGARRVLLKEVFMDRDPIIYAGTLPRLKRERDQQERVASSAQRTRKTIRQRCMSFGADRLLTLTYRENMQDRTRCYADTIKFIARCQAVGLLRKYVAVPELQKRGAWHVHIACRGYMQVLTLRRIWRAIVGQDNGNIDLSYRQRNENNPWRIASYLGKYIGKALEQASPGDRTFWASEWGGQQPTSTVTWLPHGSQLTQVLTLVTGLLEQMRLSGAVGLVEAWSPRSSKHDPPDKPFMIVFWAA